ncbi:mitochondrial carrier domain-containing protein [Mycena maculata]|uniref:Mitochondrial carrier domain-containing protein n=1 Tax=Mycena maculata TaxID=230809 RepID=A0AAD7ID95_9AGAR|nr:mitochondrial carrier domain-containing protein [Mycena maculata]
MDDPPNALEPQSSALRAAKDIGYGILAGIASKIFEHPFDLTKVRLQSQVLDAEARFTGPIDCLNKTWRNEGVRGLYRGLPAPIVGAMAENASLFLSYRELQDMIKRFNRQSISEASSMPQVASAGAGAGAITSFLLTPIELVKCKMQVQMLVTPVSGSVPSQQLLGPLAVFMSVVRSTGVRGLWLGHTGTFIRETGGTAAWFSTKEFVASLLVARRQRKPTDGAGLTSASAQELRPWESAVSGASAGASFNLALFPADTVKSAMQTEEELRPTAQTLGKKASPKPSFFGTFMAMYRAQGIKGLYAGCGITVARSVPSSAIIFLIYDGLSKRFG